MDKKQAQQLIQQLFTQPFEMDRYQHFLRNLLNRFEPRDGYYTGNYIPDAFKQHVNQYWRVGKYVDPDGNELDLLVVEVKTLNKLERARSALRNFAVNRLKQFEKEASLIAFYAQDDAGADWRFSFVKIEHEAFQDEKGKVKLKQELTPARRYSYLVGVHENSHTACKQLLPVLTMDYADPRIEEIEAAFSIEKITDEFFDQYKALFQKLAEHLKKQRWFKRDSEEETDQAVSRFAKKLLGQVVFLYFLQKKGWLGAGKNEPWGNGDKKFLRARFAKTTTGGGNYYRDFLQYLFYEALACERKGQTDPGYYQRFDCRVPFLNGGLFEANYDWQNEPIEIPNHLFHNDEPNKAGDKGTGILDVFDRYNFTIKEDEPLDKEVAVDPEMLGKVFENMLEITERKSKGAFYTPREIVHYMCQESLIHYLDNRLNNYLKTYQTIDSDQPILFGGLTDKKGQQKLEVEHQAGIRVPKEELEILIRKGHLALENDTRVISKGKETETYKFQLPEAVRSHAKEIDTALADIKVCDPAIGSGAFPVGLLHEIVNARLALAPHSGNDQSAYDLKRHAIAESIYGVDIDASAIDIARLRLWLSLIVDEEDYGTIEALPNLDYKIVQGNSLIGFPENWQSPAADKIEALKKEFFAETDHDKKAVLKEQIDNEIQKRLAGSKASFGYQVDFDFRLFFSEVWHYKNGFDVVVGNPPYVLMQDEYKDDEKVSYFRRAFEVAEYKVDLYHLFFEKSNKILNRTGFFTLITPTNYQSNNYTKNLRKYLIDCGLEKIVIISGSVFSASVNTSVTEVNKAKSGFVSFISGAVNYGSFNVCNIGIFQTKYFGSDDYLLIPPLNANAANVLMAIENKKYSTIGDYSKVNFGMQLRDRKQYPKDVLLNPNKDEITSFHKPCYTGKDIKPFSVIFYNRYCYFNREAKKGGCWNEDAQFSKNKILIPQIGKYPQAGIDRLGYCVLNTAFMINLNKDVHLETVLSIINSDVTSFYWINKYRDDRETFPKIKGTYVEQIPVATTNKIYPLEIMVRHLEFLLQFQTEKKLFISFFQQLSNAIVTELYFPDEIKAAGKEILPHLGELSPITDQMSDEEKLAIIQREFDRLYDPRHPVRNNLETLDSVDVVRTIREALKK